MTSVMLRRAGFAVIEAADGASALAHAEQMPDVVVLDVRLPDIDGFGVSGRRILIVEDNADVRDGLVELCQMWGHEVFTAGDGIEGVRVALERRPDIAFVDIGLPGLDGYEVAGQIRAASAGQDLLLVALTGYGSREQKARAIESGFDHHLVKPVDTKLIEGLVVDLDHTRETSHRTRMSID